MVLMITIRIKITQKPKLMRVKGLIKDLNLRLLCIIHFTINICFLHDFRLYKCTRSDATLRMCEDERDYENGLPNILLQFVELSGNSWIYNMQSYINSKKRTGCAS
jgi:hypothetical protein